MQFVRHPTRDPGFFRSVKMSFDHLPSLISLTRQTVRRCPNLSLEEEPQPGPVYQPPVTDRCSVKSLGRPNGGLPSLPQKKNLKKIAGVLFR